MRNPVKEADFALKEVHQSFEGGAAYALLGPSGHGGPSGRQTLMSCSAPSPSQIKVHETLASYKRAKLDFLIRSKMFSEVKTGTQ